MKVVKRLALLLLGLLLALAVGQLVASESGEVVVLTTSDAEGESHTTRVWVVDYEGQPWLRAGAEIQEWYQRLLADPSVEVERNWTKEAYTAVPVPTAQRTINDLMFEKYGWADAFIAVLYGRDDSVPIRLDPPGDEGS
ncbi:MAG: nitroreductase/quinone reductase family protein [Myxococcota bacterium]